MSLLLFVAGQRTSTGPDLSRFDHIEIPTRPKPKMLWTLKNKDPLRAWTEQVVSDYVEAERKEDRPKTRKVKAEVVQDVIDAVGTGLLATVRPTPEIRQAVSLVLTDNSADRAALYAEIADAIRRQIEEQDDEDIIMLLLAA